MMEKGLTKQEVTEKLARTGEKLGFDVFTEVEAAKGYWPDIVWLDRRIPPKLFGVEKPKLKEHFVLPLVGFEIEEKTYSEKSIKGSIVNLEKLNVPVGVIVLSRRIIGTFIKEAKGDEQKAQARWKRWIQSIKGLAKSSSSRIVVMTDEEIDEIHERINQKG